ncbi:MAG: DUF1186 domain-containing protein [Methanomicrobiales archaeon]|jgi:hypothetical protein|nr:DUF1186 domain-containing protein [Methanomicrobiales archaeon]
MELHQALENIKRVKPTFAEEEIHCIREHKDEAIPVLLRHVQDIVDNPDKYHAPYEECDDSIEFDDEECDDPIEFDDPLYALFLLAEFRVNDALESFLKILKFDEKTAELLLGDTITSDCGRLIASVADTKDIDRIKLVIENGTINPYHRLAALRALITMYFTGAYSKEELFSYLGYVLNLASESDYNDEATFISFLVSYCHTVEAKEHFPFILELYEKDMIDRIIIESEDFIEGIYNRERDPVFEEKVRSRKYSLIHDTIKEMHWWYCFQQKEEPHGKQPQLSSDVSSKSKPVASKKVGRNDPCPCGSGKKYKKCCLNNEKPSEA